MIARRGLTGLVYARWRYEGMDPTLALMGPGAASSWPARVDAVLAGFSVHAAGQEGLLADALRALGQAE